jgi:putative heme iron utilization protein
MTVEPATEVGKIARALIRQARVATLSTLGRADSPAAGHPFGSLVLVAADHDATPLLLISSLAEHTKNLAADARVSLLFDATASLADPLTGARLTLLGRAEPARAPHQRTRFLARHPSAEGYVGFRDFAMVQVRPGGAHLVAGFGRIHWLDAGALRFDLADCTGLIEAEAAIIAHMNADHEDAVALYATRLLELAPGAWHMTGIDPEGFDLGHGHATARIAFESPVRTAAEARAALVVLAQRARGKSAIPPG